MNALREVLALAAEPIRRGLEWLPFPAALRRPARRVVASAGALHPRAPLLAALVVAVVSAELALWLARQPLFFAWQLFGAISGNSTTALGWYNVAAHLFAAVVAAKVLFELRVMDEVIA